MAAPEGGYVLIHRRILDNPVFKSEPEAWAFAALILRAAWKPTRVKYRGQPIVLERGQVAVSYRDFGRDMGRDHSWAQRLIARLEQAKMVERKRYTSDTGRDTPVLVLTICNYDKFQSLPSSADTPREAKANTEQYKEYKDTLPLETTYKPDRSLGKVSLPEWIPADAWAGWLAMRKVNKKPATERAQAVAIKQLTQWRKEGHDAGKILDAATLNNWTGLWLPKGGDTMATTQRDGAWQRVTRGD